MNKFHNILKALNEISAVSGKKDKERLVKEHIENTTDFEKVIVLMLDPFKRFYIKSFDITEKTASGIDAYDVFEQLSNRSLSGDAARLMCGRLVSSGFPGELMLRILNKDPKAGFGESTVNKAKKGLIPDFPYMRCALPKDAKFSSWDWERGVVSQEKADGMYATLNISDGEISIASRSGKTFNVDSFPNIVESARKILKNNTQTQGELLVCSSDGKVLPREIGNGMLNKVAQGGDWVNGAYPVYRAWDQIPLSEVKTKVKYSVGYADRLHSLSEQLKNRVSDDIAVIETKIVHSLDEAKAHYREMLESGKEGTILSEPHAPWIDGTSKFKIKLKLTATCELVVTGWRAGNGKNSNLFGSLICESSDGLLEVAVSGFKDAHRKEIFENINDVVGSIMSVDSNMLMEPSSDGKKWSLFLPRFAEFRLDKKEADSLKRIKEQFDAAVLVA